MVWGGILAGLSLSTVRFSFYGTCPVVCVGKTVVGVVYMRRTCEAGEGGVRVLSYDGI